MERERYGLLGNKDSYIFYSEGPKGRIRKVVQFQHIAGLGKNVYNLVFGDFDELTHRIQDNITSNNGDREKVLFTVADTVIDFWNWKPGAIILIRGSSLSRTRLYQIAISSLWPEINEQCEVLGKVGKEWLPFKKGINYEEFLVFKKIK